MIELLQQIVPDYRHGQEGFDATRDGYETGDIWRGLPNSKVAGKHRQALRDGEAWTRSAASHNTGNTLRVSAAAANGKPVRLGGEISGQDD